MLLINGNQYQTIIISSFYDSHQYSYLCIYMYFSQKKHSILALLDMLRWFISTEK